MKSGRRGYSSRLSAIAPKVVVHPGTAAAFYAEPSDPLFLLVLRNLNILDRNVEALTLNHNQVCSSCDRGSIGNGSIDVGSG